MNRRRSSGRVSVAAFAMIAALGGCEDAFGPRAGGGVTLSFTTSIQPSRSLAADPAALFSTSAAEGTIRIDEVDLVLARIRLRSERSGEDCENKDRECADFRTDPVLVRLPLTGGTISPFTTLPPAGSYDRLDLHIHQPGKSEASTRSFFAANPGWPEGASVRVEGTYTPLNGATPQPFEVFLKTSAKLRQSFDPAIVIGEGAPAPEDLNVTVEVDVNRWFRTRHGAVIDPRALTTDQRLLREVERNIRDSFRTLRKGGKGKSGK